MADEIQKFDPSTLMQGVKDRIKATFVSLIPDEQWEEMVQKEINAFFTPQNFKRIWVDKKNNPNDYYSSTYKSMESDGTESPFRTLVWDLCFEKTQEILRKKLLDEWFGNSWPITEENIHENLKEVMVKVTPLAMAKFFENLSFYAVQHLRNELQNFK